jgi:glutathione peroxidase-family protein
VEKLDGEFIDFNQYRGQVVLIINVATFCAYTQQYMDFAPLLAQNADLKIIAFPCNQFFLQEPAENHEILNGKFLFTGCGKSPWNRNSYSIIFSTYGVPDKLYTK